MGDMNIKADAFYEKWSDSHAFYFKQQSRESSRLPNGDMNENTVEDLIYHLAQDDNICIYLWQKYGTQFIEAMKEKMGEVE